ncbi:N-acetylglucosamine-6-phosphate deacetylase [Corynebacterium sp. ES2775-CONJ]|uniref:N-acetylglucosamine-6-phosphate deacetylase n=1 Tax=Corynebacterium sp. ES2775-CONJ TaxID=2974029 RepID=UPI002167514B|nr:amidohydrolase family protein [Corynebacterium sp. ES2775-CONJ]MCS4489989.1 amidohydrolase family protein [Corynebacterium sp. ES2775-CONJ]
MADIFRGRVVNREGITPMEMEVTDGAISALRVLDEDPDSLPILFPGFTDIHNHGGAGESFPNSDLAGCRKAARYHAMHGTTSMLASLVSATEEILTEQTKILAQLTYEGEIAGIHMEGPFVNPGKCGAQDPDAIMPGDPEMFNRIASSSEGTMRSVTFAPETAHAKELVDVCVAHNIIVSLGHTNADADTTWEIVDYALSKRATVTATHLFNAMPAIHHREPGAATALIDAAEQGLVTVEVVADGVHLNDHIVNMVRNGSPHNTMFITDAMAAAGLGDGDYVLGALPVTVSDGVARLTHGGAIAGGTSTIHQQLRRHTAKGWTLDDMVPLVSQNAAALLQLNSGELEMGRDANFVIMDEDLSIQSVYRLGKELSY